MLDTYEWVTCKRIYILLLVKTSNYIFYKKKTRIKNNVFWRRKKSETTYIHTKKHTFLKNCIVEIMFYRKKKNNSRKKTFIVIRVYVKMKFVQNIYNNPV